MAGYPDELAEKRGGIMAARIKKHHQDDVRAKIQAIKLVQLLQEHATGDREMTASQIQAAKILLDKSVSNAPTEISGPEGGPMEVTAIIRKVVDPRGS